MVLSGEADFECIEQQGERDPALTCQIKLASLGNLGKCARHISTMRDALVLAGADHIRNWRASLLTGPAGGRRFGTDAFFTTMLPANRPRRAMQLPATANLSEPHPHRGTRQGRGPFVSQNITRTTAADSRVNPTRSNA